MCAAASTYTYSDQTTGSGGRRSVLQHKTMQNLLLRWAAVTAVSVEWGEEIMQQRMKGKQRCLSLIKPWAMPFCCRTLGTCDSSTSRTSQPLSAIWFKTKKTTKKTKTRWTLTWTGSRLNQHTLTWPIDSSHIRGELKHDCLTFPLLTVSSDNISVWRVWGKRARPGPRRLSHPASYEAAERDWEGGPGPLWRAEPVVEDCACCCYCCFPLRHASRISTLARSIDPKGGC